MNMLYVGAGTKDTVRVRSVVRTWPVIPAPGISLIAPEDDSRTRALPEDYAGILRTISARNADRNRFISATSPNPDTLVITHLAEGDEYAWRIMHALRVAGYEASIESP